ncbi:putative inner membrane protein [Pirellula sp. SH-Sr6A]|uniref:AI-2E family transporter n=1 Tax=Pirellula sp. SH-Sr6A TaxID=1632865 RepID=UPI00078D84ED|nr:AI-2E family transporter [Pirellula sp. SH-Sr6A]AMV35481.1 putative inner membrane protein [Pirellula sp. SH-Sr6A]
MARYISFAVLLGIIVVIGALFYKVMIGFFIPVFLAAVLVVVFRPLHRWVCSKVGERDHVSAGITTTLIVLIVLIPAGLVLTMAAIQGAGLVADVARIPSSIQVGLAQLRKNKWVNLEYPHADIVREIQSKIDDIQNEVTTQRSLTGLMEQSGLVQGDIKVIRRQLDELVPRLREFSLREIERQILDSRGSASTETGLHSELAKVFLDADQLLEGVISGRSKPNLPNDESIPQTDLGIVTKPAIDDSFVLVRSSKLPELSGFDAVELEAIKQSRTKYMDTAIKWMESKDRMLAALDRLASGSAADMVELQRESLSLSQEWSSVKETLYGGEWLGLLKELANPTPEQVRMMTQSTIEYLQPKLLSFTGDSAAFLVRLGIGAAILLLSLYFFLCDGPAMIRSIMELSPLDDRYELELLAEFDRISRAIVLATVLSALLQGLTAGIGYYFVGMPSLILLTALTCTCALVPFVGPAIVWVPVCFYLAVYQENLTAAIGLGIWGSLVVASVDNVVKMLVLHGQSQLHPLLALLSVLGGIQALGPIGILIGPMVVVLLQTLLGILRQELGKFKKQDDGSDITEADIRDLSVMIRKPKLKSKSSKNLPDSEAAPKATPEAT